MEITKVRWIFYVCIATLLLQISQGCKRPIVFQEHYKIPDYIWEKSNILEFNFVINDTSSSYDIVIDVRHATYYFHNNLKVKLTMISPVQEEITFPVTLPLRDKNGEFTGKGAGDIWDNPIEIFNSMRFPVPGTYHFLLENDQPEPKTVAIMEMGVVIRKVKI